MYKLIFLTLSLFSSHLFSTEMASIETDTLGQKSKAQKTMAQDEGATLYPISNYHLNRIVTPFKHPSFKMDSVQGVTHKEEGNVIYLSTTANRRIAGFITEAGSEEEAISVILVPKKLPPQEIIVGQYYQNGSSVAKLFERSQPRIDSIKEVLATLAKGDMPKGYIAQSINMEYLPHCAQNGLDFNFFSGQLLSGGHYLVSIGVVTNTAHESIELLENNCHGKGVIAVSAFPSTTLLPNERSEVFVMFNRENNRTQTKQRKSLLD